jgi:hypothetical protein
MNIMVTIQRKDDGLPTSVSGLKKIYDESFRNVDRLEWRPHHIVFHFKNEDFIVLHADRVVEMVTYED